MKLCHTSMLTILSLLSKYKDVEKIEKVLNNEFSSLCEWFIDNNLLIHFWDDKTKTIFFSRNKSPSKLSISYGNYS